MYLLYPRFRWYFAPIAGSQTNDKIIPWSCVLLGREGVGWRKVLAFPLGPGFDSKAPCYAVGLDSRVSYLTHMFDSKYRPKPRGAMMDSQR